MIGKAIMGADVGGLLRYLYGPGDHNDHKNPHIVGAWRPDTETLEPKVLAAAGRAGKGERPLLDFRDLTHRLKAAHELMTSPREKYVMHVPLSSAPEDPILSDEQWADVAATTVKRMGLGEGIGDDEGCRWVAIRHDDRHVHLVVTLARQDGKRASIDNNYDRIKDACHDVEKRYGLKRTGDGDGTATEWATRGEVEKFKRLAAARLDEKELAQAAKKLAAVPNPLDPTRPIPAVWDPQVPRHRLREIVQEVAAGSGSVEEFLANLGRLQKGGEGLGDGLVLKTRLSGLEGNLGEVTGYSVGLRSFTDPNTGQPIMYGGGKLDRQLALPRLKQQHGWALTPARPVTDSTLPKTEIPIAAAGTAPADMKGRNPAVDESTPASLRLKLRQLADRAAGESTTSTEYFERLKGYGVEVKPRFIHIPGRQHEIDGYSVALKGHYNKGGDDLKWLSGSKLDSDGHLSLPRLEAAWGSPGGATGGPAPIGVPDAVEVLEEATKATTKAVRRLDKIAAGAPDPTGVADDVARSAADLLRKTAAVFEPPTKPGPLTDAARAYDRVQRPPRAVRIQRSRAGADLSLGAIGLGMLTVLKSEEAQKRIMFLMATKMLIETIAELRSSQQRLEAAQAARSTVKHLDLAVDRVVDSTLKAGTPEFYRDIVRKDVKEGAMAALGRPVTSQSVKAAPLEEDRKHPRGRGR